MQIFLFCGWRKTAPPPWLACVFSLLALQSIQSAHTGTTTRLVAEELADGVLREELSVELPELP
jgi:hypothetical protein